MSEQIFEMLGRLDNMKAMKDVLVIQKQKMMDVVITPEVKALMAEIEEECGPDLVHADKVISELTAQVKTACVEHGSSIKGENMRVSFIKGRVTWDSKGLAGYAVAHPEIKEFMKTGKPYAAVKNV